MLVHADFLCCSAFEPSLYTGLTRVFRCTRQISTTGGLLNWVSITEFLNLDSNLNSDYQNDQVCVWYIIFSSLHFIHRLAEKPRSLVLHIVLCEYWCAVILS